MAYLYIRLSVIEEIASSAILQSPAESSVRLLCKNGVARLGVAVLVLGFCELLRSLICLALRLCMHAHAGPPSM